MALRLVRSEETYSDSEPPVSPKRVRIEPKKNVAQCLDLEAGVSPGRWSSDEEVPEEEDGYEPSFINDKEGVWKR